MYNLEVSFEQICTTSRSLFHRTAPRVCFRRKWTILTDLNKTITLGIASQIYCDLRVASASGDIIWELTSTLDQFHERE